MKRLIIFLSIFCFCGCATFNFSSKYYQLPPDYENEIEDIFNEIKSKVPLKYKESYAYRIVKDKETTLAGIPQIQTKGNEATVLIPEYFIAYIWEFYYPTHNKEIIACLFAHEFGHVESGISDSPREAHLACDKYSMEKLLLPGYTVNSYYSSLVVLRHYWSARKGVGGHLFNIGWNAANIASLIFGGPSSIGDLFVTDLDYRIAKLRKGQPKRIFSFKRNR